MTWRILAAMRSAASKISCSPLCWSAKSPWAIRRTTRGSLSSNRSRQASRTDAKVRGRKYATAFGRRELKTAERSTLALDSSSSRYSVISLQSAEAAVPKDDLCARKPAENVGRERTGGGRRIRTRGTVVRDSLSGATQITGRSTVVGLSVPTPRRHVRSPVLSGLIGRLAEVCMRGKADLDRSGKF